MVQSTFDMAETSLSIIIYLIGIMTLWLGIMKIGEKGGAIQILSRWVSPFFQKLFPDLPKNHPASGSIMMNFSANMLGLDNAATPLGLKAMEDLQSINKEKDTASNAQIMFLVLNTSGLTLIPISVLALRGAAGAATPSDVFIPILLATFFATLGGLIVTSIYQKINLFNRTIIKWLGGLTLLVVGFIWFLTSLPQDKVEIISRISGNFILFSVIISFLLLGIKSKMEPVVSQCFGVADLSLLEITSANATFANLGVHIEPIYVLKIEDKNGNTIYNMQPETSEAMDERTAYTMLSLMEGTVNGVYNKHQDKTLGTAVRLRYDLPNRDYDGFSRDIEIAGKTGTTQNQSDGWFIGLTPDLVTGVWVGAEDRSVHFRTLTLGMGTNMALPVWGYYMKEVYADSTLSISQDGFEKPEGITVELDCESYGKKQSIFDGSDQLNW